MSDTQLFYLIFGIWGLFEINKYKDFVFNSEVNLDFHKKYSNKKCGFY